MHAWEGWGHSMYPVIYPNSEKKKNGFSVSHPSSPIYSTMPSHFLWIANIVFRIYVKKNIYISYICHSRYIWKLDRVSARWNKRYKDDHRIIIKIIILWYLKNDKIDLKNIYPFSCFVTSEKKLNEEYPKFVRGRNNKIFSFSSSFNAYYFSHLCNYVNKFKPFHTIKKNTKCLCVIKVSQESLKLSIKIPTENS